MAARTYAAPDPSALNHVRSFGSLRDDEPIALHIDLDDDALSNHGKADAPSTYSADSVPTRSVTLVTPTYSPQPSVPRSLLSPPGSGYALGYQQMANPPPLEWSTLWPGQPSNTGSQSISPPDQAESNSSMSSFKSSHGRRSFKSSPRAGTVTTLSTRDSDSTTSLEVLEWEQNQDIGADQQAQGPHQFSSDIESRSRDSEPSMVITDESHSSPDDAQTLLNNVERSMLDQRGPWSPWELYSPPQTGNTAPGFTSSRSFRS